MKPFYRTSLYNRVHRVRERAFAAVFGHAGLARATERLGLQPSPELVFHRFALAGAPPGSPPLRIAFAADFHAGALTHPRVIARACESLAAAQPHVLLLGGDFVSVRTAPVRDLASRLAEIPAPLGRYAVLGNHDYWADAPAVVRGLEAAGIELLTNRNLRLPPPFAQVWLCGLDDAGAGRPEADRALAGADGVRIVLMHSPEGLLDLGDRRFELALCGHTHGGQVALPGGRAPYVPAGGYCRKYSHGVHRVGPGSRSILFVSRGVGSSEIPVRLFATPDVLVCDVIWEDG